ncbi:hypothetical protein [Vannielia sp.]|uniref:hypothetical protein n=1 Tax=Vannielia sp. TaxID=2813045 RepID=UPI002616ECA3|nr:hypothetical protein [Vannielia sp.]MDF1873373.1 hypothetical protein [Vannielia sp.]
MIVLAGIVLGALLGFVRARQLKGKALDKLQYMAVYAILGALTGLLATIILERLL